MKTTFQKLAADSMDAPVSEFIRLDSRIAYAELIAMDFCKGLVQVLLKEMPTEFINHEFYRWSKQKEDVFICWGVVNPISIQVDPSCEVIVALGAEYGSWTPENNAVKSFLVAYRKKYNDST